MKLTLIIAQTLDGKIGRDEKHEADWTSPEDKKAFAAESKKHGVIIMGSATFDTIRRPLPNRLNIILTSQPKKYQADHQPGVLEFFKGSPQETVTMLEKRGYQSAALGGGARTNAAFLKAGLVDEVLISIEPKLFGQGISLSEGQRLDVDFELIEEKKLNKNTLQLRYKVIK